MVHIRINEKTANPNPYVNFVSVLPVGDATTEDQARQILQALAAQVKPIMKEHGFTVNSLEEYEFNHVFSGRNWNNGETIELVLRGANGSFLPVHWLMSTLCHELAHIKHMNHGPAFQNLWLRLRQEVRDLQNRGYFGDGYWSAGRRLADSAEVAGQGIQAGNLPEYMCGGAHSRVRPVRGYRSVAVAGPSLHTGAQTTRKRKAGSRVTSSSAFPSTGKVLNDDLAHEMKAVGTGFRKQAASKRAREERALAAEKRVHSLRAPAALMLPPTVKRASEFEEEEIPAETDEDRRRTLLESTDQQELDSLKATNYDFSDGFLLPRDTSEDRRARQTHTIGPGTASDDRAHSSFEHGNRKKRSLNDVPSPLSHKQQRTLNAESPNCPPTTKRPEDDPWNCLVCTLTNEPGHLACSACATPRGDSEWIRGKQ
ncbi:WLM-domain-containing protein [Pisolithus tinctorius]|nr:WLM-domain-containing protein [Pisolithus tinctorius]